VGGHIHVDDVGMEQETGGGDLRNRVHYLERTVSSGCDAANGEQGWGDSLRGWVGMAGGVWVGGRRWMVGGGVEGWWWWW